MQTKQNDSSSNDLPPTNLNTRLIVFRIVAIITCIVGVNYIIWRYFFSLNHTALWFSIPLILAETYSVIDLLLFSFMMWKPAQRNSPEPFDASVDVFITTYNEPIDLVRITAQAAKQIEWSDLRVYILDDGSRPEAQQMAREVGCEYITRGEEWKGMQRHAKAGNVNNALMRTSSEFILILDADQIPSPKIIQKCIGFFRDSKVAFVQTPQSFYNLPPGDPFGSDAPLFYGPILIGKDGWNAAFFCGSNAMLRREALMQLGLRDYVQHVEQLVTRGIQSTQKKLSKIDKLSHAEKEAINLLKQKVLLEQQKLKEGQSLEKTSEEIREAFWETHYTFTDHDIESIAGLLRDLAEMGDEQAGQVSDYLLEEKSNLIHVLKYSPESIGIDQQIIHDLDLTRANEAQPILPLSTISITEDMATAMQLHAAGWKSVFYPEILAYGLAPEDLGSALSQRLRWAQGTLQVLKRDNPLFKKGLSIPQRLSYFTTMFSYFSGFPNLIFLLSPIVYLFTGIAPVNAYSWEFMLRLIPFLLLNKITFRITANKIPVFRGEQYNLGLFSLWIQAVTSVLVGKKLGFVVTPKQRQSGNYVSLVWPQLIVLLLTLVAIVYGIWGYFSGSTYQETGLLINIFWGIYNCVMLSAIVRAAVYKPPAGWQVQLPDFSSAKSDKSSL